MVVCVRKPVASKRQVEKTVSALRHAGPDSAHCRSNGVGCFRARVSLCSGLECLASLPTFWDGSQKPHIHTHRLLVPACFQVHRTLPYRANCSEYFPLFITILWVSGLFFSQGLSSICGLLYLYGRFKYFRGYAKSAHGRLAPLYFSAKVLWVLIGFSGLGILSFVCRFYLGLDLMQMASSALGLTEDGEGGL
uniref:Leukotriene C4 synthase n=1 Tax=Esox lucius TaxID=8010 RepID=A0AAY5JZE2_ESOLU